MDQLSVLAAFTAGIFSFFSPCVLPLLPAYLSFITGIAFSSGNDPSAQRPLNTAVNSVFFILGFSLVFVALGQLQLAQAAAITHLSLYKTLEDCLCSALFILGAAKIPFLNYEARFRLKSKPAGYFGSFAAGVVFSAGWSPCVGPILGSILVLAASDASVYRGTALLVIYSLGLGIPFFLASLSVNSFIAGYKKLGGWIKYINLTAGALLLATGAVVALQGVIFLASPLN